MSIQSISPCRYLFGQEANVVFAQTKLPAKSINDSLQFLMDINEYLFTRKSDQSLPLYDPAAFNNQCHLYALMVIQKINEVKKIKEAVSEIFQDPSICKAITGYAVDDRYLHYAFFLSYAFSSDLTLMQNMITKIAKEAGITQPGDFTKFLKDSKPVMERMQASRTAILEEFSEYIKKGCAKHLDDPLFRELYQLAQEDLKLSASNGKGDVYTYPKLGGIPFMLYTIAHDQIALCFKVKVVTKMGTGVFTYQSGKCESDTSPVLVFELVATDDSLSYLEYQRDIAKKCPHYSMRNPSSSSRHDNKAECPHCKTGTIDITPYKERYLPLLAKSEALFYALGADFLQVCQPSFERFFTDSKKYPLLTELFQKAKESLSKLPLSMSKPLNMSVSHVYSDTAAHARSDVMILSDSYDKHLAARRLT